MLTWTASRCPLASGTRLVTVPQAHPPGDEAEVDFGEATIVIAGVAVKVDIFHLRLSHSARAVHVAFASEGQEALASVPSRFFGSIYSAMSLR